MQTQADNPQSKIVTAIRYGAKLLAVKPKRKLTGKNSLYFFREVKGSMRISLVPMWMLALALKVLPGLRDYNENR